MRRRGYRIPFVVPLDPGFLMAQRRDFEKGLGWPVKRFRYYYLARNGIWHGVDSLGLKPGGENGTYFQHIPLMLHNLVPAATFTVDGRSFVSGTDFLARDAADFEATARELQGATAVYGGMFPDTANMIKQGIPSVVLNGGC